MQYLRYIWYKILYLTSKNSHDSITLVALFVRRYVTSKMYILLQSASKRVDRTMTVAAARYTSTLWMPSKL